MDEANTLNAMRQPLGGVLRFAAADVHPPGYYLLLFFWQRLPLGLNWTVQARALSVCFLLAATVAVNRLWARRLSECARLCLLALWALSPCLLLYGRMCRSYSLQVLLTVVAAACLLRFRESPGWRSGAALAGMICAALYVHYIPGLALLATANLLLLRELRLRDILMLNAAIALAYLPWIGKLGASIYSWGSHTSTYAVTGSAWLELPVKLAYWAISFMMGEAVPDAAVIAGILLLPLLAILAWSGAKTLEAGFGWRGARPIEAKSGSSSVNILGVALPLAAIGFLGVARWVGYPFIPARMLFVFPFFLLPVASGMSAHRRAGAVALAAMIAISVTGIWCYFHKTGFRNKQYPMPMAEIAARIERNSTAADSVILVDGTNSDPPALAYGLQGGISPAMSMSSTMPLPATPPPTARTMLRTDDPGAETRMRGLLADPRMRIVWFVRSTHDVSPQHLDARFEQELSRGMRVEVHSYEPFTPLERRAMRALGMAEPPQYFQELLEFRR